MKNGGILGWVGSFGVEGKEVDKEGIIGKIIGPGGGVLVGVGGGKIKFISTRE